MADRTVSVRLQALIGPYQAAMAKATASTRELQTSVTQMSAKGDAGLRQLSTGALLAGGAMVLGFGKVLSVGMRFEKQMSGVAAVSNATADQMHHLSEAALAAGASQKLAGVTASDAAAAEAELVRAGVSVSDTLGGALMGSLTLASAGQLDFADAATIAAQAMNIFDLRGSQVTHIADVLAAAANKSAADVGQMGESLRMGGLVASQYNLSLEETVGTLAAFADNALIGSDGGTALKTMLQRLSPISKESKDLMEELGFSAYDAQGNFIGMAGVATELQESLAGMTQEQRDTALATLFGADAVRGANVLYEEGAAGIKDYIAAVNDQGAAARMAAIQNDNLSGDIEALGGALETAFIENGSKANGALRTLTQSATGLVTGFSALPDVVQSGALGLGAMAGTGALAVGVIGTMAPKAMEAKRALEKMGTSGKFVAGHMKDIGSAVTVIGAGVAVFAAWEAVMGSARTEGERLSAAWRDMAFDSASDGLDAFKQKLSDVNFEWARMSDEGTSSINPLDADKREELRAGADELEAIGSEMARVSDLADDLAAAFGISGDAALRFVLDQQAAGIDVLAEDYGGVRDALSTTFTEMGTGTVATQELAGGMKMLGDETTSVQDRVKAFADTLEALYNQLFGVEAAQDSLQSSLNELPDVLKDAADEGLNLNDVLTGQSDAAIAVRDHMRGMISDASDLIAEWQEQGITGDELAARIDYLSGSFRAQAEAAGVPGPVVDHYLGLLDQIPTAVDTAVNVNSAAAEAAALRLIGRMQELDRAARAAGQNPLLSVASITARDQAVSRLSPRQQAQGGPIYRAAGGPSGTDTIPAWLTPGEFVVRKSAVDSVGLPFLMSLNRLAAGGPVHMATGGEVPKGFELTQAMHSVGAISDDVYAQHLRVRLTQFRQFSSEWIAAQQELTRIDEENAQKRVDAQEKATKAAQDDYERRREINDNLFELGMISTEDHLFNLERRMAREVEYSDEWMALQNEMLAVQRDVADEERRIEDARHQLGEISTADYLALLRQRLVGTEEYSTEYLAILSDIRSAENDVVDEERRIEDARYELGETSTADYLAMLRARLAATERYSQEYMALWRDIQQLEEDVLTVSAGPTMADLLAKNTDAVAAAHPIQQSGPSLSSLIGNVVKGSMAASPVHQTIYEVSMPIDARGATVEAVRLLPGAAERAAEAVARATAR